jgi:hypothetical protein
MPVQKKISHKDSTIKKEARNDGLRTRDPDESRKPRVRLAIEDAVWPYAFADVGVGDLLFVDCDVYFICYSPMVTLTGRAHSVLGALNYGLVGAVIGGLAGSGADKDHLQAARQVAATGRKQHYALSLDERVEHVYKSFVIRNPASVAYNARASSITCTSRTGEKQTFYVPQMSKAALAILAEFPEGEDSLYPQDDPYGLLIWSSSPVVLTERLVQGQIDDAFLDQVASHQQYMHSFYVRVRLIPPEQQEALVANLRQTPARFRASMSLTVADAHKRDTLAHKSIVSVGRILGGILLVISLAFLGSKNYIGLGVVVLLGLACLIFVPYFANRTARRQERLMQAVLDAVGRSKQS